jgi:putative FmdB family regulatory protein
MPLYEYYCEKCDAVFDALGSFSSSDKPAKCPNCGTASDRIMPTTVATMSHKQGWAQRVPFHHKQVRDEQRTRTIARVKPKTAAREKTAAKPKAAASRNSKQGGTKK